MGFSTALSGLSAAANNLAVTGNNIANANTTGFKRSRSEFADVYATSIGGVSSIQPGAGVRVANVAQQFNQGNLTFTENNLDLAISGEGFFTMAKNPAETNDVSYTRAGEFKLDKEGYIVNNQGNALLAYKPNGTEVSEGFSVGVLQTVQIQTLTGLPKATDGAEIAVNLNADNDVPVGPFNPTNNATYNNQTSVTIYDSLGSPHTLTSYFAKASSTQAQTVWNVRHYIDGTDAASDVGGGTLTFDNNGKLIDPLDGVLSLNTYTITPDTGAAPITIDSMNYFGSTQVRQAFSVNAMSQNGLPAGRLTGVDIDDEGVIFARFSNGGSQTVGKVALTRFPNVNGLVKLGDTMWGQGANSGEPIRGEAGSNNFGGIQGGALESSNVDLAAQLVNLIVAQQTYQANAQTITTENSIMQTVLNIR